MNYRWKVTDNTSLCIWQNIFYLLTEIFSIFDIFYISRDEIINEESDYIINKKLHNIVQITI